MIKRLLNCRPFLIISQDNIISQSNINACAFKR
nr:MAG TPA: hypothetical protein [Caudoviricetes sp.]